MDFLHWCIDWIKYLMLEFPKPDNLKELVDKIGVWLDLCRAVCNRL